MSDKKRKKEVDEEDERYRQRAIYQLKPAPPVKKEQEYILAYLESGDEYDFRCYLHIDEEKLNHTAEAAAAHYRMDSAFLDMKQACVEGLLHALPYYDPARGTAFWWYARKYFIPDMVHDYVRMAKPGFTVGSRSEFDTLRRVMWLYHEEAEAKKTSDPVHAVAEKMNLSEKRVQEYLRAGMRNSKLRKIERDDEDVIIQIPYPDYSRDPSRRVLQMEREELLFTAFYNLSYREKSIVSQHLGFCDRCLNTKDEDGKSQKRLYFEDLALLYGLTPKTVKEIYDGAIGKLRNAILPYHQFGEEDQVENPDLL